ncbi:MAG TPA: FAD-dependent monooxygenase [Conexibacter sp.]|nr:FAD-dependent monooxygenase [Conexibacter sp.]
MSAPIDVLICGGGPVGLGLAIELGLAGVRCLLVERRTTTSLQPRAKLANIRTMELLRRWGVADEVRRRAPLPPGYPSDVVFATRLRGHELARFPNALSTARQPADPFPEPAQQVPQYVIEDVLRERLAALPEVELRRGTTLIGMREHDGLVTCELEDEQGARSSVAARWVVGADGARSSVRRLAGIEMRQLGPATPNLGLVLRAPGLAASHLLGRAVHYWIINEQAPAIMGPLDGRDVWWLQATALAEGVDPAAIDVGRLVEQAVGGPVEHELLARDPWAAACRIAERYRAGRVLLAGDAAHVHPPMGGYGMNMGLGDAVDLGWKLAAQLAGWGTDALVASYEAERQPIHRRVIDEAAANYGVLSNDLVVDGLERDDATGTAARAAVGERIVRDKAREFRSIGIQLGARLRDSPVVIPDETPEPADPGDSYEPCLRPGHRAPHVWLDDGDALYDRLGRGFALLDTTPGDDRADWSAAAAARGLPLRVVRVPDAAARERYGAGLALVRPDRYVAWRGSGDAAGADPGTVLDVVRGAAHSSRRASTEPAR